MGKGGGQQSSTTNIPPWAKKAHMRLLGESEKYAYDKPYTRYGGERIAGFDPYEEAGFSAREQMYERGDPYADYSGQQLGVAAGIPGQMQDLGDYYQAQDFDFGKFGADQAQQYMSPYQQAVTDEELAVAGEEYQRQKRQMMGEAVQSGAFGGYREAVEKAIGGSLQGRTLSDIQSRGSQAAFENAQQQFERDRAAAITAAKMGDESAYRAAQQRMAVDLENQKRLQWEGEFASDLAGRSADIGTIQQNRALQRIQELERAGATRRQMAQAMDDIDYEEWQKRENWPRTQMEFMASQLGAAAPVGSAQTTRTSPPGLGSQLGGLGLQAAGAQYLANR